MIRKFTFILFIIFVTFGCIDRILFDVPSPDSLGLSISGHVTNNGGPHRVQIFKNFDVQSRDSTKIGWTANSVVISDAEGHSVQLSQIRSGVYETKANELVGKVGGVYKLSIEMRDGRIYESAPDTLPEPGSVDSVYYDFVRRTAENGYEYDFVIYALTSFKGDLSKARFMFSNMSTYEATTRPELESGNCYRQSNGLCNGIAPCTGYKNTGTDFIHIHPCECCTCWYEQFGQFSLSDKLVVSNGRFSLAKVDAVKQTAFNMMYKMRFEVRMQGLSGEAFRFWKAARDQREAVTNIFQSATGRIRGNIVQTSGKESPANGIFYASSLSKKSMFVYRGDEDVSTIPTLQEKYGWFPCYKLAPNAFITPPDYWIE